MALEAEDYRKQEDGQVEAMVEKVHHHSRVEPLYRQERSKEQTRIAKSSTGLDQNPLPKAVIQ